MIAWIALVIAVLALIGLIVHAFIPFPPAHSYDPFKLRTGNVAISPIVSVVRADGTATPVTP